jgi:hypothetical protein
LIHLDACAAGALAPPTPVVAAAVEAAVGLYPIVTFSVQLNTLYQFSYHIQSLFF